LLAGRKLLLADDSITIQKVVDLTFADEGVSVVSVNNGREAIEQLEEFAPDVVLADVFMPQMNGYELCEYIKQNEKLKHIPVMLLVGSFEPFDEAEARRVGADDTLTKPFQSIRRLIDKVSTLVSGRPAGQEASTEELPKPEPPEPEKLSAEELQITTADTLQLPRELRPVVEQSALRGAKEGLPHAPDTKVDEPKMESNVTELQTQVSEKFESSGEMLLDLGDFAPMGSSAAEDFVLDIDLNDIQEASPMEASFSAPAFLHHDNYSPVGNNLKPAGGGFGAGELSASTSTANWSTEKDVSTAPVVTTDQLAATQFPKHVDQEVKEFPREVTFLDPRMVAGEAQQGESGAAAVRGESLEHLSPEIIDAIARRAVEHLSAKVVQEIAWEVVPQLAELLIKRQLEEKNS
jgi:CheY-like chemotaxis protein